MIFSSGLILKYCNVRDQLRILLHIYMEVYNTFDYLAGKYLT